MSINKGTLYIVATPIGNLTDVSQRALDILSAVDLIAAEDTRRTRILLQHYGISNHLLAYHEHNERQVAPYLLQRLEAGDAVAMVSDAGTPVISDPGFPLVREACKRSLPVVPVPGASAVICALSASGLPCDHFIFEGFAPRQASQRQRWLQGLARETRTLVFYESSHRIVETLADLASIFGAGREMALAREMTKLYESFLRGQVSCVRQILQDDDDQRKGEFVVMVKGAEDSGDEVIVSSERILEILATELPLKQAAGLAAKITGKRKNELYQAALQRNLKPR